MTKPMTSQRRYINARLAEGKCGRCGQFERYNGTHYCFWCRDKVKKLVSNRAKALTDNKLCRQCSQPTGRDAITCIPCKDKQVERMRHRRKFVKLAIVEFFGNKCVDCGETDIRCMTLDHINGDGAVDCASPNKKIKKRITSTQWYAQLLVKINKGETLDHLRLLCYNCHFKRDLAPWWTKEET